jgi:hypothetical protein
MTRAGRSVHVFGVYLVVTGAFLIASPNSLLALLALPSTHEPWIHVLGVPVMAMGMFHIVSARAELLVFFRASVRIRVFVLTSFILMAAIGMVPPIVIGFGIVDSAFALWTHPALRAENALAMQPS